MSISSSLLVLLLMLLPCIDATECHYHCKCTDSNTVACIGLSPQTISVLLTGGQISNKTVTLDLSNNELTSFRMKDLKKFGNLKKLILDGNRLSGIPSDISLYVPSLKGLRMRHGSLLRNLSRLSLYEAFGLQTLDLQDGSISNLPPNLFPKESQLTRLDLSNNKIIKISKSTFAGLDHLEELILTNNRIQSLEPGTFSSMKKLRQVIMESNNLLGIQNNVFRGLQSVEMILLRGNQIRWISSEAFQDLPNITVISLKDNLIKTFPKTSFQNTQVQKEIDLNGNPILCNCFIVSFQMTALRTSGKLQGRCISPPQLRGRDFGALRRDELGCTSCDFNECVNNGTCIIKEDNYYCRCIDGFEGEFCQMEIAAESSASMWIIILAVFGMVALVCSVVGWWYYRKQKGLSFCVITKTQCCCCCFITVVFIVLLIFFMLRIVSYMYEHS